MKLEDVESAKIKVGNTTYNMVEAKYGGVVVWPTGQPVVVVSYSVISGSVNYTYSSGFRLNAAGTNYAIATGSVQEYHNGEPYGSPFTATLNPRLPASSPLTISGNRIYGPYLGDDETTEEYYTVYVNYSQSTYVSSSVAQEPNVKTRTGINSKVYDYSSSVTTESNTDYYLESFTASPYNGTSYPCPASGGTSTLSYYAGHTHLVVVTTPWTRTANYSFTSGATSTEPYDSGTEITSQTSTQVTDTPTITGSATGFSRSGNTVTIANRDTVTGPQRSVTYTAANGGITRTVSIYQEANTSSTTYVYDVVIAIEQSGNLSYLADNYPVSGHSKRTPTTIYDSGAREQGTPVGVSATVSATNCTANDGLGNPVTSVSGDFGFFIQTTDNYSGATRNVVVSISPTGGTPVSDSRTQNYYVVQVVAATIEPLIPDFNVPGMYEYGKVYVVFNVTQGSITSTTMTNVKLYYNLQNSQGSLQTYIDVGTLQVTETTPYPLLVTSTGVNVPVFSSGDTIEAWFQVDGSTGDVTSLTCNHHNVSL